MFGRGLYSGISDENRKPSGEFPIPVRQGLYRADGSHPDLPKDFVAAGAVTGAAPQDVDAIPATAASPAPQDPTPV